LTFSAIISFQKVASVTFCARFEPICATAALKKIRGVVKLLLVAEKLFRSVSQTNVFGRPIVPRYDLFEAIAFVWRMELLF
jgi:hypothetical protein